MVQGKAEKRQQQQNLTGDFFMPVLKKARTMLLCRAKSRDTLQTAIVATQLC